MRLGMGLGLGNLLSGQPLTGFPNDFSFNFDGSNDYLDFGDISLTGEFTLSAWIYLDSTSNMIIWGDSANADWFRITTATTADIKIANNSKNLWTHGATFTTGEWQHIAVVRNSSNQISIYRNGIHYNDNAPTRSGTFVPEYIGQKNSGNYFNGLIDEVAIWDSALDAIAIGKISSKVVDLTKYSASNLKLWLRAGDKVEPETSIARSDFYTDFDSTDDYINVGSDASLDDIWTGGGTLTSWIYPRSDGESDFGMIAVKRNGNTSGWYLATNDESGGVCDIRLRSARDTADGSWVTTSREITLNQWNHIAVSYDSDSDSNNALIYVNGKSVAVTEDDTPSGSHSSDASDVFKIGGEAGAFTYDGAISNLSLHQTILDAQTIKQFAKSRFTPMRDNRFSVVDFDGSDDYIDCGTGLGTSLGDNYAGSLTTCFWFKADVTSGDDGLFNIGNFSGSEGEWAISINSNKLRFFLNNIGWRIELNPFTSTDWNHLAIIYSAGSESNSKMYLNGQSVGTASGTFPSASDIDLSGLKTIIGAYYSSGYAFDGSISSVSIYNTAKSAEEVYALYSKGITYNESSESGLVGLYRMGSDTSKAFPTIADSSSNSNDGTITNGASDDIVQQMVAGYDMGAFESTEELRSEIFPTSNSVYTVNDYYEKDSANPPNLTYKDTGTGAVSISNSDLEETITGTGICKLTITISGLTSGQANFKVQSVNFANTYVDETMLDNGTHTFYFTRPTGGGDGILFRSDTASGSTFTISNYSLKEVLQSADLSDTYPAIIDVNEPVLGVAVYTDPFDSTANGTDVITLSEWSAYGTPTSRNIEDGALKIVQVGGAKGALLTIGSLTATTIYKFTCDVTGDLGAASIYFNGKDNVSTLSGKAIYYFTGVTSQLIYFRANNNGTGTTFFSNINISPVQGNVGTMTNQDSADLVYSSVLPDQSFLTGVNSAYNFLDLDGGDQYIDCGDGTSLDISSAITLSAWVNSDVINIHSFIAGRDDGTNRNYYLELYTDEKFYWTCNGLSDTQVVSTTTFSAGSWYHVVGVYDGSNIKLYINGVEEDSDSSTGSIDNDDVSFTIGAREAGADRFINGKMGQVSLWNKALSATEVGAIYTLGRHGNLLDSYSDNLVGNWAMSSLDSATGLSDSISTIYDRSGNSNHGTPTNADAGDLASSPNAEPNGYAKGDTNRSTTIP